MAAFCRESSGPLMLTLVPICHHCSPCVLSTSGQPARAPSPRAEWWSLDRCKSCNVLCCICGNQMDSRSASWVACLVAAEHAFAPPAFCLCSACVPEHSVSELSVLETQRCGTLRFKIQAAKPRWQEVMDPNHTSDSKQPPRMHAHHCGSVNKVATNC